MKLKTEIINGNTLKRSIKGYTGKYQILLFCAVLIAYELKSIDKVQFNITSATGSIHIEFRDKTVSYYVRNNFDEKQNCTMTMSIIQSIGVAYTSIIVGKSAIECFNNYLVLSDQRESYFIINKTDLIKIEKLPSSISIARSVFLEETDIEVIALHQ